MVKKVEKFQTSSGKVFDNEMIALRVEAVDAMIAAIPELTFIRDKLETHITALSAALEPVVGYLHNTTLEEDPETTLIDQDVVFKSTCPACVRGKINPGPHHRLACPLHQAIAVPKAPPLQEKPIHA